MKKTSHETVPLKNNHSNKKNKCSVKFKGYKGLNLNVFYNSCLDQEMKMLGHWLLLTLAIGNLVGPYLCLFTRVADPEPWDPYVFEPPGSGSF